MDHLDHPIVKRYLGLLDLHVSDVEDLFHILDDGDAWCRLKQTLSAAG